MWEQYSLYFFLHFFCDPTIYCKFTQLLFGSEQKTEVPAVASDFYSQALKANEIYFYVSSEGRVGNKFRD